MIRLILAAIFVVLFLVLGLPIVGVLAIIGIFDESKREAIARPIIRWAFRAILFVCGTRITVIGEENIPTEEGALLVGNHRSIIDILIVYSQVKAPLCFVSKKEMGKFPIFNVWMKYIRCLFLDRSDIKQGMQTILKAIEYVKSGTSVFIFPEGTRSKVEGEFLSFKGGSFKVAEKSKCNVIPVAINNAGAIFEDHKPYIRKTDVVIRFGKPIVTQNFTKDDFKQLHTFAQDMVMEMYEQNKEVL